jgi:cytochrome c
MLLLLQLHCPSWPVHLHLPLMRMPPRPFAKKNDCFKCHAIDKTKKGPAYKKIAAKYKGKEAEGETKMIKNITTAPTVKLEDGCEEEHKIIDTKDPAEIKNIVYWILSQ